MYFASLATPTTSTDLGFPVNGSRSINLLPSACPVGASRRANVSLTMITSWAVVSSRSVKSRPATSGIPIVSK